MKPPSGSCCLRKVKSSSAQSLDECNGTSRVPARSVAKTIELSWSTAEAVTTLGSRH
jgi:hypothetical protein